MPKNKLLKSISMMRAKKSVLINKPDIDLNSDIFSKVTLDFCDLSDTHKVTPHEDSSKYL